MVWVLIIGAIVAGGQSTSMTSAQFSTEEACVAAAKQTEQAIKEMNVWPNRAIFWSCSPQK
jgi:hypothetical protein